MSVTRRGDLQAEVFAVAPRQRLLGAALALELAWLALTAAALVFLAAHLGSGGDDVVAAAQDGRFLVYVVPPVALLIGTSLVGARRGSRPALWGAAAANSALAATIAASLYHAEVSWMVLGSLLLVAVGLVTGGCVGGARR
jgi:hypothetical protein